MGTELAIRFITFPKGATMNQQQKNPNIWSGAVKPAWAALTNPTEMAVKKGTLQRSYPVTINNKTYPDAETAYLALRSGPRDIPTLIHVMTEKLFQHPELADYITQQGGVDWLHTCQHNTNAKTPGKQFWEGIGVNSPFIKCLISAYGYHKKGEVPFPQRRLGMQ